jgi:putative nucleotidyltransferase with HDIG domain
VASQTSAQAASQAAEFLENLPNGTLSTLVSGMLEPTAIYSASESQRRLDNALNKLSNSKGAIAQGQILIRRGDIVTEERAAQLESYIAARSAEVTQIERWTRMAGEMILVIGINLILLFYLRLYRPDIFDQWRTLYPVLIVIALMTAITRVSYSVESIQPEMVPLAIAPIVLTILFDQRLGMLAMLTLASTTALIQDSSYEFYLATMMAGSAGVFSVKQIQKRTHFFFTTPAAVLGGYVLVYGGLAVSQLQPLDVAVGRLVPLLINAALILFAWPLLLLFEKGFGITTDLALQELSDTNHPLMKKLMNEAPGTFHHSLQVSNLAENAANAIGANGMLCRVGGYFHDIGKMDRPQFFVENQTDGNRHDVLNPIMSQKIIREHVSKGVDMGREAGLPAPILDIIQTHHGTSLIRFFFDKAQKTTDREKEVGAIEEEDYRYDGPLPTTKEEGILMLADGVEAASRAVKPADEKKLDALIGQLIEIPLEDGQLDQCPLTIPEINAVRESFFKTLKGLYHQRIEYPEDKEHASGPGGGGATGDAEAKSAPGADEKSTPSKNSTPS